MKQFKTAAWFIAILSIVLSCKKFAKSPEMATVPNTIIVDSVQQNRAHTKNTPTDIYTNAAVETCNCMHPMLEKAKQLKELESNKKLSDMKRIANEMEQMSPEIQKCSDEIRKKYVKLNGIGNEKRIKKALLKECPDMATLILNLPKMANN
jgi:hypothetical protein